MNTSEQKSCDEHATQFSAETTPGKPSIEPVQIFDELPAALANQSRYRVVREIGKGGMGKVYLAEHATMNRLVAIKVIRQELIGDDQAIKRFRSEILATAKLSHTNVVTAYDAESNNNDGSCYLVTEYVDGYNLSEFMSRQPDGIPVAKSCDLIFQAANGLQHALDHGLVHRDIKPHNLLIDSKGTVKVSDFGLALIRDTEVAACTESDMILGSVDYMAPEQATDSHAADTRSDIYALGCTLFHLLAGKAPFAGGSVVSKLKRHATAPRPSCACENVTSELDLIVRKMMDCDPANRYQTPKQVADALIKFRSPSTLTSSGSLKPPIFKYIAMAAFPLLVFAGWVVTVATDSGNVVIESGVDDIEVVVMQGGKAIELLDGSTGSKLRLRTGTYELDLKGEHNSVRVSPTEFRLLRGNTQVVRITHDNPRTEVPQVIEHSNEKIEELEKQILGWYDGGRGMRLTILPADGKLVGVIDWGNAAPCSVYEIRIDGKTISFWQPEDEVKAKIERQDDPSKISSITLQGGFSDVRFAKQIGLTEIVGQFANTKNQIMNVSHRKGELYCSIDWGNNAPLTNGFVRAAPNGTTLLQGFKWQEILSIDVVDGALGAIILANDRFTPTAGQATQQGTEQSQDSAKVLTHALFAPDQSELSLKALLSCFVGENKKDTVTIVKSLHEGVTSSTDILVVAMNHSDLVEVGEYETDKFLRRKVLGIGYGAAQLFEEADLNISAGNCAHGVRGEPRIKIQENSIIPKSSFPGPYAIFDSPIIDKEDFYNDILFGIYVGEKKPQNRIGIEVIALFTTDKDYAPITRQNNSILIGVNSHAEQWSVPFRNCIRALSRRLASSESDGKTRP